MSYAAYLYLVGIPMAVCVGADIPTWRGCLLAIAWPVSFPAVLLSSIIRVVMDRVRA